MRRKVMEQWSENGFKSFFEMGLGSHVSSDGRGVWWSVREAEGTTAWDSASVPRRPVLT